MMVTAVYILTSLVFIYLVPMQQVTSGETFAAQPVRSCSGALALFSLVVVVAVLGCLAAVVMSAPRVYFAMARDGLFVRSVASLHPRYETPAYAIALQAVLASILVMVGSFNEIMSYFVFVVIVFIALTVVALFKLRRTQPNKVGYLTPGYPVTPAIFLALLVHVVFVGQRQAETGAFRRHGCILGISGLSTSVSW